MDSNEIGVKLIPTMSCDYFQALNLAKNGHLEAAHKLVQPYTDGLSCLIHAYIHRAEGDLNNADYWYQRAGSQRPNCSLEDELNSLYNKIEHIK